MEQLAKDTEELKTTEQQRSEKLDNALSELETVMADLKTANRRRDDDSQRIREEIQGLKDAIPKALESQKSLTDNRLYEINTELGSLKTLVSQRMSSTSTPSAAAPRSPAPPAAPTSGSTTTPAPVSVESVPEPTKSPAAEPPKSLSQGPFNKSSGGKASIPAWQMAMQNKASGSAATNGASSGAGEGASASS